MSRLEQHEIDFLTQLLRRLIMTDIADNVIAVEVAVTALTAQVTALATAVVAIQATTVDLTPVLDAIAGVATMLSPTPAPAPAA